ncbi:uncharacterized protein LOC102804754 isoform X2 [Saccoglossus kowalevskii]
MMGCSPSKSVSDPQLSDKERNTDTGTCLQPHLQEFDKTGKYRESDNLSTDDDTSQKLSQNDLNSDSNNKDSSYNRYKHDNDTEKLNSINRMKAQPQMTGVLATNANNKTGNNRQVSQSQTEFFQMLDEKIEKGRDTLSEQDIT